MGKHYTFIDYATQGYLAFVGGLVLVFHGDRVPGWGFLVSAHAAVFLGVHQLLRWHGSGAYRRGWVDFLRHFYPMLLYIGFYRESGWLNQMFVTGYLDPFFIRLEERLFGQQPSLTFMEGLPYLAVSEVFYASYFSYYVMIIGTGVSLYLQDRARFSHYLSVISFMFYVCYVLYILLPVIGPRIFSAREIDGYTLPLEVQPAAFPVPFPLSIQAGPFFQIMRLIYATFESSGAAIPSSHVAVAVGTLYFSSRYWPRVRRVHLVLVILLCLATVYCRYHYVVDVVAGLLTAAVLLPLGNWLYGRSAQSVRSYIR